jgi:6,7-dimethyl-8-ribityllumazine synthase
MSDRYETPSWDDEPRDLGSANRLADDASDVDEPSAEDADLESASENVFDAWPVASATDEDEAPPAEAAEADAEAWAENAPAAADDVLAVPPDAEAAESEVAEDEVAGDEALVPALADHVSASSEHAPGDLTVPPGYSVLEGVPSGERRAVGIVVSRFNGDVTTRLLESALDELDACGVSRESITVMPVPGAFELPLAAMALAKTRRFACIVALGCVIRGDTPHFDYVASEAASGLQLAAIETGVPVAFGVLTLDRADQAESREAKGADAVRTALEMADVFANLRAAAAAR